MRNGVEDFVEHRIADVPGVCVLNERQRKPFTHDGQVARAKELKTGLRHGRPVSRDQVGVVVGSGTVRAGDEDQL